MEFVVMLKKLKTVLRAFENCFKGLCIQFVVMLIKSFYLFLQKPSI